jgi:hypothetical protein
MRSFILRATIAAALASIPASLGTVAVGYAASSETSHSNTPSSGAHASAAGRHVSSLAEGERIGREHGKLQNGQGDPAPYMTDPMSAGPSYQSFGLTNRLTYRNNRLATIESELGQAIDEVNVDRRRGKLTPREARFVRREDAAVRAEAVDIASQNGGRLPMSGYAMLQDRVSDLNRTVHRYETNGARG